MKLIKIILYFFICLIASIKANSNDSLQGILNEGGKLIFIRHAYAPGNGDPENFDIFDCKTQRNLNKEGIEESKNIGLFFKKNDIKIDKVLSSEWCRCKDTAAYAFKNFETKNFLNSFYSQKFANNKKNQIKKLKEYIQEWDGKKNLVLITHFVVILEALNLSVSPAEIIITDNEFNVLARQKTQSN